MQQWLHILNVSILCHVIYAFFSLCLVLIMLQQISFSYHASLTEGKKCGNEKCLAGWISLLESVFVLLMGFGFL